MNESHVTQDLRQLEWRMPSRGKASCPPLLLNNTSDARCATTSQGQLRRATAYVVFFTMSLCCAAAAQAELLQWVRQLGTASEDASYGISTDGLANVYISGYTYCSLGGTSAGGSDAFVAEFVPEPSTLLLAALASVGLLLSSRHKANTLSFATKE